MIRDTTKLRWRRRFERCEFSYVGQHTGLNAAKTLAGREHSPRSRTLVEPVISYESKIGESA